MLCDKTIEPLQLKGKIYHAAAKLVILYARECLKVKSQKQHSYQTRDLTRKLEQS